MKCHWKRERREVLEKTMVEWNNGIEVRQIFKNRVMGLEIKELKGEYHCGGGKEK